MKVTIYSTPTCPWCHKTKDWLKDHKVAYTDVNIAEDDKGRDEMIEKSGQMGVPVTIIEDGGEEKIIVGFDEKALSASLMKDKKK